jgi:hypothetical protein
MTSTCNTSLDLCAIRVARLTTAGAPVTGAGNGYVSVAPQKLDVTVESDKANANNESNGCGVLMGVLNEPAKITGISFKLDLCQLDAELMDILTGASLFNSGGNAVGYQFPSVGSEPPRVCLEGWSKAWDVDHQLVAPFTTPNGTWIRWVFPNTQWVQDTFTLEHAILITSVNGVGSENSAITANGPFNDWPTAVANAGGVTRIGGWFFDPDANVPDNDDCTYVTVTSAAS